MSRRRFNPPIPVHRVGETAVWLPLNLSGGYNGPCFQGYFGNAVSGNNGGIPIPQENPKLRTGAIVMLVGALSFIGYAVVFFFRNFGEGFELGVDTLGGVTQADLNAVNPVIVPYIGHLHIATAGFIAATGIAVAALAWYGVRRGEWWAWVTAVVSPVVGLAVALPMHYLNLFTYDWLTHLGPIYLGTLVFVVGALIALRGLTQKRSTPD